MPNAYLGTPNEPARVPQLLESWGLPATKATAGDAARLLAEGNIIGRIAAGAEYGPRALGNRSILADPRIANMLEIVNTQIKHRERYRPFAPSCHADKQDRYFDLPCPSPFMLMACAVLPGAAEQIPAVIHVDGTSRVQSVMPLQNERYYELIDKFGEITGVYTLLNTSFNDDGEPIVETYEDALLSFVRTGLHYLYAEDYLIKRPEQAVCARIRNELASQIREGVARRYAEEIALFCDGERYSSLERSVKGRTVAYGVLIMSEFMRRARAQKFEERNDTSSYGNWIRVALNRFGSVARHSRSKIARSAALVPMIITRFFIVARESLETPRH